MLDLHTNATEQCFEEARRHFDAQLFRESLPRPLPHSAPFCILYSAFCIHLWPCRGSQNGECRSCSARMVYSIPLLEHLRPEWL